MSFLASVAGESNGIAGGPFTRLAEEMLGSMLDGAPIRLTTSGTDALELAGILAGIEPGDVVIVPSFGFVTTALAFVRAGARIRFADIDERTLGLDPADLESKVDSSVRAVVPIHYAGLPCDVLGIREVLDGWDRVLLVEDNAHGLFGAVDARPLGTFGDLACLSFHGTKNVSCGEGGALVINRSDLVDKADVALEKGTDRTRFLRGEIDKYTWRDLGSSFGMGDYLAALLIDELKRVDEIQTARAAHTRLYQTLLTPDAEALGYRLPLVKEEVVPANHLFYTVLDDESRRDDVLSFMTSRGVSATFHYPPLHLSPGGRRFGDGRDASCPVSEKVAASIVRLPLHDRLTRSDIEVAAEMFLEAMAAVRSTRQSGSSQLFGR